MTKKKRVIVGDSQLCYNCRHNILFLLRYITTIEGGFTSAQYSIIYGDDVKLRAMVMIIEGNDYEIIGDL
jgi:hypothetical protein